MVEKKDNLSIKGSPLFRAENATVVGTVTIGNDVGLWFGAVIRGDRDSIKIGNGSNIQDNAVVHTSTGHQVTIGDYVSVGHGAIVHGATIGDRVLVGMGSIVMNGADVGEDSIIGAGAVVTEGMKIPPRSVVLGLPARVLKEITDEQAEHIVNNAKTYIGLAKEYANE